MIIKKEIPFFVEPFEQHDKVKQNLLQIFNENRKLLKNTCGSLSQSIKNTDWDTEDSNKKYFNLAIDPIMNQIKSWFKLMEYTNYEIKGFWFQQYTKGNLHDWHRHGSNCNFIVLYYVELPEGTPKTEFKSLLNPNEIFTIDVKEGDIMMFPSNFIHRSPENNSNNQKTIISINIEATSYH